jgi:hypothetical protein
MPPRRAANVLEVVWRGTGSTRYGGTDARWQRQIAYDAAEKNHFRTVLNKLPRKPERTQLAQAGWPGVFTRALPKKLTPAPSNELDECVISWALTSASSISFAATSAAALRGGAAAASMHAG